MNPGVASALGAAVLFGASTPFAKLLLGEVSPLVLAATLYLGRGIGLAAWIALRSRLPGREAAAPIARPDWLWIAAAIAAIVAGGVLLSAGAMPGAEGLAGALLIVAACLAWAIDNNLTRRVSGGDAATLACLKGLAAGTVNLGLAMAFSAPLPSLTGWLAAGLLGFLGYGVSLVLFIIALRNLGTARTGAYFSVAPFAGAALAIAMLGERPGPAFWLAAGLMALGVWLHLSEHHEHAHEELEHSFSITRPAR